MVKIAISLVCLLQSFVLVQAKATRPRIDSFISRNRKLHITPDENLSSSRVEMAEVILATLENKLRKVENLDRAVQHLMRRLDGLEAKIDQTNSQARAQIDEKFRVDTDRFNTILSNLDQLKMKFDSVCEEDAKSLEDDFIALPSVHQPRLLRVGENNIFATGESGDLGFGGSPPLQTESLIKAMDEVKDTVHGMDRRLAFHINIVSENLGKMDNLIRDVHETVSNEDINLSKKDDVSSGVLSRRKFIRAKNGTFVAAGHREPPSLDTWVAKIQPLEGVVLNVQERMETLKELLLTTKSTLDDLVPRSDQLLEQSHRQERSLLKVQDELNMKTDSIIMELGQIGTSMRHSVSENLALDESENELRFASPNDLDLSESASAFITTAYVDGTPYKNLTFFGTDLNSRAKDDNLVPTKGEGPSLYATAGSRGPSVIFPSVENKPIVINSTFMYDSGRNFKDAKGYSCADLYHKGLRENGIYYLQIDGTRFWYMKVYCEMTASQGGWTIIQRRNDFGEPRESFNRDWEEYKYGFGDPKNEFWLGNENIHLLTQSQDCELRIELEDFEGNIRYADYRNFRLGSEKEHYRLEISGYHGTAGDSLNDPWYGSNLRPFSTFDRDHDRSSLNCASMLKGGWWWKSCGRGLNGLYLTDPQDLTARQGIVWFRWRGWDYSLKRSQMMIRPRKADFRVPKFDDGVGSDELPSPAA
ncbi:hypothetical protein TCAL_11494 [Tigriopus californicus]|uniref:Fibrinogen C-terminal domain-containing protein n=2 Tax=Tigriopus californicus TaxID=6832 RepID=A0A553NEB3_TIGCA|nr:hypothetical protein TCAL_11494 [Tigriopus californicus]